MIAPAGPGSTHTIVSLRAFAHTRDKESCVDVQEIRKLDAYLKKLFGSARIRVVPRPKKEDSAEVYVGEEFIGQAVHLDRVSRVISA